MEWSDGAFEEPVPTDTVRPSVSVAVSLFRLYARSVNIFFPILEASVLDRMISQYSENNGEGLVGRSRELFYLILAVATLICKRNEPTLATNANSHFLKAISIMSTDCDHSSMSENITLLQRTLLICVYLLLSPESGDIWRHLGFAIRHFLDLSHGRLREEDELYQVFCKLSRTIYCLESQVSIAFGRPSLMIIGDELRQVSNTSYTGKLD
ncbi:hypothetical protein BKA67DRAFT_400050 [Truncatella angustata]|uniref:Xylanolytic transcriptional activator regulatory domain-containing protein n=1 Tax=Truncatella angustata TaxID=152316 RepID=A0A9P8RKS7_9PEZI|nr:uncharacterized protein BKA67DRAFT_400050 [Truncatella angustata]KAH6647875.1 hypothetical protein BKA67DRAFT_400050 [Truncatella angustata]